MRKPDAWMLRRKKDGFIRSAYASPPSDESLEIAALDGDEYQPLFALTDEERKALSAAIVYMGDALCDSDYAGDTPDEDVRNLWRTNSEALRKHIAALEGLLGKPAAEGQDG